MTDRTDILPEAQDNADEATKKPAKEVAKKDTRRAVLRIASHLRAGPIDPGDGLDV